MYLIDQKIKKGIVHRVVAVVDDDPITLRTKGDNNQNSIGEQTIL
ncbi:MAG: hypothetical protein CM1200mP23_4240 [Nitrososphaerota archaeon]|nr:MAG: hypothetical protein CM1200mP23_4240 [Nitrososphaerota archaeon]